MTPDDPTSLALPILGIFGPGRSTSEEDEVALSVGSLAARAGWVVLTGGGTGVMAAGCRGAAEAGGLTVAILPTSRREAGYPNPWVKIPIFTGAGMARNAFNVLSSRLCVAIGGGPGTLSEMGLAMKANVPVWTFCSWTASPPRRPAGWDDPRDFDTPGDLLAALATKLAELAVVSSA